MTGDAEPIDNIDFDAMSKEVEDDARKRNGTEDQ